MDAPLIVLAAGLAARMGRCKATIDICGASALENIVTRASSAGAGPIVVVTGCREEETRAEALRLGCGVAHNPLYETGMYSSVLAGVRALPSCDRFMLLPVDTPMIKTSSYRAVMDAFERQRPDAAYPTFRSVRGHPPVISASLIPEITSWSGKGGLRALLRERAASSIDVPTADRAVTLDMDTPDDLALLRSYAERERCPDNEECAELLEMHGTPQRVVAHMRATAELACAIADALTNSGARIDTALVRSAALLHDIAKEEADHAAAGARILRDRGAIEAADAVASHMDIELGSSIGVPEVLYLADKMTQGERVVTIDERELMMIEKFAGDEDALASARSRLTKAREIKRAVERAAGVLVDEIAKNIRYTRSFAK